MVLLIDNIPTPYTTHRYNEINKVLGGELEVWYLNHQEANRSWGKLPQAKFNNRVLDSRLPTLPSGVRKVILCGWNDLRYLGAAGRCRNLGIPYYLWSGSTALEKHWLRPVTRPLVRWVIEAAEGFVAYGTRSRDYLIFLGADPQLIKIFYNSVDLDHFASTLDQKTARKKLGLPLEGLTLVYIGQLIERKNVLALAQAHERVRSHYPNLQLVFCGQGPLASRLEGQTLSDYDTLPLYYAAADALILPSKEEVWGLVVNEAMAAGKPCAVSVTAGCVPDLIFSGQTGWRILPTAEGIERALVTIASTSDEQLAAMGQTARALVEKTNHAVSAKKVFTNF